METDALTHPIFRDAPPPETRLWRYLSFAKIIALFQTRRLHFTRVDQFDDHFEGAWPKSDLERFAKLEGGQVIPTVTKAMRQGVAASCWLAADHESAAMWRLYAAGEEGVAITTTAAKLQAVVSAVPQPHFGGISRVRSITATTALSRNCRTVLGTRCIPSCARTSAMSTKKRFARCLSHGPTVELSRPAVLSKSTRKPSSTKSSSIRFASLGSLMR